MEHSEQNLKGTEGSRNLESLDLESVCASRVSKDTVSKVLKRKRVLHTGGDGIKAFKRKRRNGKEVNPLCNLGERTSRSLDEVYSDDRSSSGPNHLKSPANGLSHCLHENVVQIPRRPRGFIARKRNECIKEPHRIDSLEPSSSRISYSVEVSNGILENFCPKAVAEKIRRRSDDDFHGNRRSGSCSGQKFSKENNVQYMRNGLLLGNKRRRNRNKRRVELNLQTSSKHGKFLVPNQNKLCGVMHEEDEENLEQNAARMLSSRFDSTHSGITSNGKVTSLKTESQLSFFISRGRGGVDIAAAESKPGTLDNAGRVLRPRKQGKKRGFPRKRRHFYELMFRGLDPYWVLHRRIKVFWPLDQIWYFGLVNGYDPEQKLHHVNYDDRDEEWINLQNERFKLLLFPSEVPGKRGRRKRQNKVNIVDKVKRKFKASQDGCNSMDSEPIISWLSRSNSRIKSPHALKMQKHFHSSADSTPPECDVTAGETVCSSRKRLVKLPGIVDDKSDADKLPLVYYRKRYHNKDILMNQKTNLDSECRSVLNSAFFDSSVRNLLDVELSLVPPGKVDPGKPFRYIDSMDLFSQPSLLRLEKCYFEIDFSAFEALNFLLPVHEFLLFRNSLLLLYGTMISPWPVVYMQILLVDNISGLNFFSFRGCLRQIIIFISSAMTALDMSIDQDNIVKIPVISIGFRLSSSQDFNKDLVFVLHRFSNVKASKWLSLYTEFKKHCLLVEHIPLSECTHDRIRFNREDHVSGEDQMCAEMISWNHFIMDVPRTFFHAKISLLSENLLLPFGTHVLTCAKLEPDLVAEESYTAALENTVLNESNTSLIPSSNAQLTGKDVEDDLGNISAGFCASTSNSTGSGTGQSIDSVTEHCEPSFCCPALPVHSSEDRFETLQESLADGINAKIHARDGAVKPLDAEKHGHIYQSFIMSPKMNHILCASNPTAPRSMWNRSRSTLSSSPRNLTHGLPNKSHGFIRDDFGCRLKKQRTHVSYMPSFGCSVNSSTNGALEHGSVSQKRLKRGNDKAAVGSRSSEKDLDLLFCNANILIISGDRCWRENGARIVLELVDHNEWFLVVKRSGVMRYSYKAHQFLQPGTTNRYTHDMMWRGGKDWILEFTERSQWALFKEMHDECHDRNVRAAFVKNIPIPGVHMIEETDANGTEIPFFRSSPMYHQQLETDMEMAMNLSRTVYEMDSDDEKWILESSNNLDASLASSGYISEEMFEKAIDILEKSAFSKQRDHFTSEELDEFLDGIVVKKISKNIYEYWQGKRKRKEMPLIRQFQPPLWEKYLQQMKEWELGRNKPIPTTINGGMEKLMDFGKPPMFAFCLKPRGLEVSSRGSAHRSHKKLSVIVQGHGFPGDYSGRRVNGFGSREERSTYPVHALEYSDTSPSTPNRTFSPGESACTSPFFPDRCTKLRRSKSRKIGSLLPPRGTRKPRKSRTQQLSPCDWSDHNRPTIDALTDSDMEEFRLRDASAAAQHAVNMAKLKRQNAQTLLYRADLAVHKAAVALTIAEAIKDSSTGNSNVEVVNRG